MSKTLDQTAPGADATSDLEAAPRTSLKSWLAVASMGVGTFALVTSEFLPVGLLTHVAKDLNVTSGTAGLMLTLPGIVGAIAAPALAVGSGKLDRRIVLWLLTALMIATNLLAVIAPNFPLMLAGRLLLGVSVGGFWAIASGLGNRLVQPADAGKATSIIFAGISLGTVLGVPAGTLIGELAGWRAAFGVTAALGGLLLLCQILLLPAMPPSRAIKAKDLPALLRNPTARAGFLAIVFIVIGHFASYTYVTPFLKQIAGMDGKLITSLLLAYGVAGFVGNFIGGIQAARNVRNTLTISVVLLAASALLFPIYGTSQIGATVLLILWGLAFGGFPISLQTWMFKSAPEALESGSALFVSTFQIFIAVGSAFGGWIVDSAGLPTTMVLGGLIAALAIISVWISGRNPDASGVSVADMPKGH